MYFARAEFGECIPAFFQAGVAVECHVVECVEQELRGQVVAALDARLQLSREKAPGVIRGRELAVKGCRLAVGSTGVAHIGSEHDHPLNVGGWEVADALASAECDGSAALQEEWHIGAELCCEGLQLRGGHVELPEVVQSAQGCRRVAAAAAESCGHGNCLFDGDVSAAIISAFIPKKLRCLVCQIVGGFQGGVVAGQVDVFCRCEAHGVVEVNGLHDSGDFVIAVVAAAEDLEGEVNFGVGFEGEHPFQDSAAAKQRKGCPSRRG